jgi:hypothetical protein
MEREKSRFEDKYNAKLLLNQTNYILKNKKLQTLKLMR